MTFCFTQPGLCGKNRPWQPNFLFASQGYVAKNRPWQRNVVSLSQDRAHFVSKYCAATIAPSGAPPCNRAATVASSGAPHETAPPPSQPAAHHLATAPPTPHPSGAPPCHRAAAVTSSGAPRENRTNAAPLLYFFLAFAARSACLAISSARRI